ncbi:MAG: GNAT family N-acetyltransferase [Armatimonadetes bacterium]|nr:GNAT family N-acetyltransferase [Armatimonadota bacterium]
MVEVVLPQFGDSSWSAGVELRRKILRQPLGLEFTPDELQSESDQTMVLLEDGGIVVAVAMVAPLDGSWAKIRQVAVDPSRQGSGLGRAVMAASEEYCVKLERREVVLHARETVVPFYLRIGYEPEGDRFVEVGIPHRRMVKHLK